MKHIKMMVYGEPGVGKSVFACKFPKPFFITTDGNYEWLEEFGAKPEDHIQVNNWDEVKKAFESDYDGYETVVVDLIEDMFKWCEFDFCTRKKIDHIGDLGYGKGYDITRNEFFIEVCKLIGKPKNIIFVSHEEVRTVKDRRGVESTYYKPSSRIPDKVLDMIEGRLRYVVRCYLKAEKEDDDRVIKRRFLSLVPKENEYGIVRGINENKLPSDIPLETDLFLKEIGLDAELEHNNKESNVEETNKKKNKKISKEKIILPSTETNENPDSEKIKNIEIVESGRFRNVENVENVEKTKEKTKNNEKIENTLPPQPIDRIAEIKAKLAALKAKKGN